MKRVVVAHEVPEIRDAALRVVHDLGFTAAAAVDGEQAMAALLGPPPADALVVGVALPVRAAYEVVDEIRTRGLPIAVVLIASVYSRTAYKRRPTSLYGADDYVEQHHVTDALADKLVALLGGRGTARDHDPLQLSDAERAEVERIRAAGEAQLDWAPAAGGADAEARRIARLIACDLLLYDGAMVADLLASGGGAELVEARLPADVAAARALVARHVPAAVRAGRDLVGDALTDLLRRVAERHRRVQEATRAALREKL